jgi:hypothetical protein
MDRVMLASLGGLIVAICHSGGMIFAFAFDSPTSVLTLAPGSPVLTSSLFDLAVIDNESHGTPEGRSTMDPELTFYQ